MCRIARRVFAEQSREASSTEREYEKDPAELAALLIPSLHVQAQAPLDSQHDFM